MSSLSLNASPLDEAEIRNCTEALEAAASDLVASARSTPKCRGMATPSSRPEILIMAARSLSRRRPGVPGRPARRSHAGCPARHPPRSAPRRLSPPSEACRRRPPSSAAAASRRCPGARQAPRRLLSRIVVCLEKLRPFFGGHETRALSCVHLCTR